MLLVNVKLFTVNSKSLYLSKNIIAYLSHHRLPYPYEGYKSHHLALFVSEQNILWIKYKRAIQYLNGIPKVRHKI